MIKRTLHFGNPAHLSTCQKQLVVELKDDERTTKTVPIEDIGLMVLEHPHITLTTNLLEQLIQQQVALVSCDSTYLPIGLFLPLNGNSVQTERMRVQLNASQPLKKQLWQQTIKSKIENQRRLLKQLGENPLRLEVLVDKVKSGDSTNCEGQAAAYYWKQLYGPHFVRGRYMTSPNAQLNYGYAILRSLVARALTASGLFPSIGIHHKNKYNAYCLADDVMEPFRPYVDWLVLHLPPSQEDGLSKQQKIELLKIPQMDIYIDGKTRPLFHGVSTTTASLFKCYEGSTRKLKLPTFIGFDYEELPF